jgi:hypothetical protein
VRGFGKRLKSAIGICGHECIYKEGNRILHARIRSLTISSDGIYFSFDAIPSVGLSNRSIKRFKAGCTEDQVVIGEDHVSSPMAGWSFYLKKKMIGELIVFAGSLPEKSELFDRFRKLTRA